MKSNPDFVTQPTNVANPAHTIMAIRDAQNRQQQAAQERGTYPCYAVPAFAVRPANRPAEAATRQA